jgi:hypothetical protein
MDRPVAVLADATPGGIAVLALVVRSSRPAWRCLATWPPRPPLRWFRGSARRQDPAAAALPPAAPAPLAARLRWLLFWRRRRRRTVPADIDGLAPDELPDLPAELLALTADQLAAAGRYAEAVRERLRAIVRELIDREVIEHRPGWTVTELAAAAFMPARRPRRHCTARPPYSPASGTASDRQRRTTTAGCGVRGGVHGELVPA